MSLLFDSNILIDHLRGYVLATAELKRELPPRISIVTKIEVLTGIQNSEDERRIRRLLEDFVILPLTDAIAERAAVLRRERGRLKLPDAIILATAHVHACTLVTRNTRDFPVPDPAIHIPYTL